MTFRSPLQRGLIAAGLCLAPVVGTAQTVEIRLGTQAPSKSPWYRMLEEIGQDWRRLSGGRVTLRILNSVGDERVLVQKMRVGQLHAVAVSGIGLAEVDEGAFVLQLPMLFESYDELDHVRDRIAPRIERDIAARGLVVLNWSDVGWVHFFTKKPVRTPDEMRHLRIFTSAGDADTESIYKAAGFKPQPLATTDLLTGLQSGMVDAIDMPPLFALLSQSFALAPYMVDMKWAVLTGATIVDRRSWDRVPAELRQPMADAARAAGRRFRDRIRTLGSEAVTEMQRQGLQVVSLDATTARLWRAEVEAVYPRLKGTLAPADLVDEVARTLADYRRERSTK